MNLRYQDNLGHLNGYDFFNVSDQSNFQSDNPSNYYSEHSGSHVLKHIVQIREVEKFLIQKQVVILLMILSVCNTVIVNF